MRAILIVTKRYFKLSENQALEKFNSSSVAREAQQMFQMASYLCMYLTLILSFFRNRDYTRATTCRFQWFYA